MGMEYVGYVVIAFFGLLIVWMFYLLIFDRVRRRRKEYRQTIYIWTDQSTGATVVVSAVDYNKIVEKIWKEIRVKRVPIYPGVSGKIPGVFPAIVFHRSDRDKKKLDMLADGCRVEKREMYVPKDTEVRENDWKVLSFGDAYTHIHGEPLSSQQLERLGI